MGATIKKVDICVIGGGSGGLSVAAGAAQMGASTILFERAKMGGDCLNYGCVPSKALLAAGRAATSHHHAAAFGLGAAAPEVSFQAVHDHVHGVIAGIAPHDSVERFEGLGVQVISQAARFIGPNEVEAADGTRVRARRFVIATGSAPATPPIPGLDTVPHFTNETIFNNTQCPAHLIIIGGGPIGVEMAQAHRRLGAEVSVLEMFSILGKDDPELAEIVKTRLGAEGIALHEGIAIVRVEATDQGVSVIISGEDKQERAITGSHLLVAAGRRPNTSQLNLEAAEVTYSPKGIEVDERLRTTNKKIFAIGDVAGGYQFTHMAGYHAGIVIRNALFRMPAKVNYSAVPWVTYTDPELANVGLSEAAAREKYSEIRVLRWPFAENDRARAEHATDGFVKAITDPKGRILGAAIVGAHAGELLAPWILAISQKLKIGAMAGMIAPYPTLGEVSKRAAGSFYIPKLFSPRTRKIVRFLAKFG